MYNRKQQQSNRRKHENVSHDLKAYNNLRCTTRSNFIKLTGNVSSLWANVWKYSVFSNRLYKIIYYYLVIDPIGQSIAMLPAIKANSPRNTRDHIVWTAGNGDPMHEACIPHSIPHAWAQQGWNKRKKQTRES